MIRSMELLLTYREAGAEADFEISQSDSGSTTRQEGGKL